MPLREYQQDFVARLGKSIIAGKKRLVAQKPTGGGKTVTFCYMANGFTKKSTKDVWICVHREELLEQTCRTYMREFGELPAIVSSKSAKLPQGRVIVAMIDTVFNRIKKHDSLFDNAGMFIFDEVHRGEHNKIYSYLPKEAIVIGFSATPKAANKKHPLNKFYEGIVCSVNIPYLIDLYRSTGHEGLLPNITYTPKVHVEMDESKGNMRGDDFDTKIMGSTYSNAKHILNTVEQYKRLSLFKKCMVFNCNVEHSLMVTQAFNDAGIPCKHLDGSMGNERRGIMRWFKETPGAVLCNIDIATTGFDDPEVYCIIVNRDTMSLPLWLQMGGRGARPHPSMDHFIIVDMGRNWQRHQDWSHGHDWEAIFKKNIVDRPKQVAPIKSCPACDALISVGCTACPWCGHVIPREMKIQNELIEFQVATANYPLNTDIAQIAQDNPTQNAIQELHLIKNMVIDRCRNEWGLKQLSDDAVITVHEKYQEEVKKWCKFHSRHYNEWIKTNTKLWLDTALNNTYAKEVQKQNA